MKNHSFTGYVGNKNSRKIPWPYCIKCGLFMLRNKATETEASKPCKGSDE